MFNVTRPKSNATPSMGLPLLMWWDTQSVSKDHPFFMQALPPFPFCDCCFVILLVIDQHLYPLLLGMFLLKSAVCLWPGESSYFFRVTAYFCCDPWMWYLNRSLEIWVECIFTRINLGRHIQWGSCAVSCLSCLGESVYFLDLAHFPRRQSSKGERGGVPAFFSDLWSAILGPFCASSFGLLISLWYTLALFPFFNWGQTQRRLLKDICS